MIDTVRSTVLAILNKNNYGYITPSDFNLFAKQAQLDIFANYIKEYNSLILDENLRKSGTGYADVKQKTEADIEKFFSVNDLHHISANRFYMPSLTTTGDESFKMEKVVCYDVSTNPRTYRGEAEKVSHSRITTLNNSHLTKPSVLFPAFVIKGDEIQVFPESSFTALHSVEAHYIRYPKAPKWTYVSLTNGEPVFDQTQPDYQDFEIDEDEEFMLVIKILQAAGISIRENEVYAVYKREEMIKEPPEGPQQ